MSLFWLNLMLHVGRCLGSPMTWIAALWGAFIGSFLNVCIFRIPEGTFFKSTRSVCRNCGKLVPFYLNLPILGWLLLRGKARCCGEKLSSQYPLVEALTAFLFILIYWKFPFMEAQFTQGSHLEKELIRTIHGVILVSVLVICSVIDLRHMIIPDVLSLPMIGLSPLVAWVHPDLTLKSSLWGVFVGFSILYAVGWIYWFVRKEIGLGMGDVKLLAALGGWLGVQSIAPTLLYGSLIGSFYGIVAILVSRKVNLKTALPFGPFLALGALIHFFWGDLLPELLM